MSSEIVFVRADGAVQVRRPDSVCLRMLQRPVWQAQDTVITPDRPVDSEKDKTLSDSGNSIIAYPFQILELPQQELVP